VIFLSPHAGLNVHIRDPQYFTDPASGFREVERPSLVADFLDPSCVASGVDDQGNAWNDVRGGSFDTDEAAGRLGWTDEEKLYAEAKLLSLARNPKEPITLWEPAPLVAPWKTYDSMANYLEIASLAEKLDCVGDALAYEQATKNRDGVVRALSEKLSEKAAEEALTAA